MAEETVKKLEEQLNCSVCLDTYTEPKLLQCFHVYCRKCLVPLVDRDQSGQLGLACPICRQVTPIPDRGVAGLPPAFHINHFLEILQNPSTVKTEAVGKASSASAKESSQERIRHCFDHAEDLKLYCETCGKLVCVQCIMKGGKHHDHDCEMLKKALEKYKEEIAILLDPMEKQVSAAEKALTQIQSRHGEISDQRATTADSIHVTFRRLQEVLDARETELISQLDKMTQGKLKDLAVQQDQTEIILTQLNSCVRFMKESLKADAANDGDILETKANTIQKVNELNIPLSLDPEVDADLTFSTLVDLTAECQNYGQVFTSSILLDPSKCHAFDGGVGRVVAGETSTAVLHAVNAGGKPYIEPIIKSVEAELVSVIGATRAKCTVEKSEPSQYEIKYRPAINGEHQLHIKVEGQHIRGSPFGVVANSPVEKFGTPVLTLANVGKPWGVAITKGGEVIVTEEEEHCISKFTACGEKLHTFRKCGSVGRRKLYGPHGVAVDGEGSILVCDAWNNRILKLTTGGQFINEVGTRGNQLLQFDAANGIAFNANNNKAYIVEAGNHRVQVLNSDLTFYSKFGREGSGEGQFKHPWGIACNSTGNIYVADTGNNCIQVFTAEGVFLRMFGRRGQGRGQLNWPNSIAIDTNGMLYVSEHGNCRISIFTGEGLFLRSFGRKGQKQGEFDTPRGLVLQSGLLYVCDAKNNRIQVF